MTTEDIITVEEKYALFWKEFQPLPVSWANALLRRPRLIRLLFLITYGVFLLGMILDTDASVIWSRPETIRPWIGDVFIGMAEPHLLTLAVLPVAQAFVRWTSMIPETFEWLRKPVRRINSPDHDFDEKYLSYLNEYQQRLLSKKHSAILSFSIIFLVVVFMLVLLGFNPVDTFRFIFLNLWSSALLLFLLIWGYFIGLVIWPVYLTMQFIKELSRQFNLEIQPSHPDKCGGLKPLGDFCFSMSKPVLIGGLVLSFVGVVGLALSVSDAGYDLYKYFEVGDQRKFLTTNYLDNAAGYITELNAGHLTQEFSQEFDSPEGVLSPSAEVKVIENGREWKIYDRDRDYIVFNIGQQFSIYEYTYGFNPFFAYLSLMLLVFLFTPLIFATFFVPLWNIHRFMEIRKREAEDEYAIRVAGLEQQIRVHIDEKGSIDEAKIARDKLEIIEAINPNTTGYPVWPFKATMMLTLFSPQILSVAGFALSVYEVFRPPK